mmetsp:Transcript_12043/g.11612  ORF Transcript_12043/g.11612 Transcript_12043/m.11612 type:complete len:89 (+) Transcript_12043:85-351(+)
MCLPTTTLICHRTIVWVNYHTNSNAANYSNMAEKSRMMLELWRIFTNKDDSNNFWEYQVPASHQFYENKDKKVLYCMLVKDVGIFVLN